MEIFAVLLVTQHRNDLCLLASHRGPAQLGRCLFLTSKPILSFLSLSQLLAGDGLTM